MGYAPIDTRTLIYSAPPATRAHAHIVRASTASLLERRVLRQPATRRRLMAHGRGPPPC